MTKIQEAKVIGHQQIEGKKVPVIQPEVHQRTSTSFRTQLSQLATALLRHGRFLAAWIGLGLPR